ncbi:type II secretion system minor pseudopilin GspK [Metallibacterium scheffleri]|nr:type II secretion system minor pseudopilin GspK [Metallibacterium scheffleri]
MTRPRRPHGPAARHARGVALLIALLIVAILASASTALAWQQTLAIRRTEDLLLSDRAWALALGGEAVAAQGLATSLQGVGNVNLTQPWARPQQGQVGADAVIIGSISDLQGLFNLNDLAPTATDNAIQRLRFQRLLSQAGIDPGLVDAVADWSNPIAVATGSEGAGDAYYLGLQPPYRTGAAPFVSASSLRLVRGFTQPVYALIAPSVSALPQVTTINVNTAPAPVLEALGLSPGQAQAILTLRAKTPFTTLSQFLGSAPLAGLQLDGAGLDVGSAYFQSAIAVHIGRVRSDLDSVLALGNNGKVTVLLRARNATP